MDFGDAFVLNQLLEQTGLATGLAAQPQSDSLKALLCFYVLGSARLEAAPDWLSASYAQVLYLKAHLDHAVKLLTALGSEPSCACLSRWMAAQPHEAVVAIESAGLPQSVQFPVSAVNGPQDAYSEALRLVFMVDQVTGAPLRLCNRALFALKPSDTIAAPLVERSAASVRGHLLMTLMAEVLRFALKAQLSSTSYHPQQALLLLRAQKIKLNAGVGMITEASAPVTALYQALEIECPTHITLSAQRHASD